MSGFTIRHIAAALGGKVTSSTSCNVPGPGHSKGDESLTITIGRGGRLIVYSHAGDDWKACRDHIDERIGAPKWEPQKKPDHPIDAMSVVGSSPLLLFWLPGFWLPGFWLF